MTHSIGNLAPDIDEGLRLLPAPYASWHRLEDRHRAPIAQHIAVELLALVELAFRVDGLDRVDLVSADNAEGGGGRATSYSSPDYPEQYDCSEEGVRES